MAKRITICAGKLGDIGKIPNAETIKAIEDARSGQNLERIDDLDDWLEKLK